MTYRHPNVHIVADAHAPKHWPQEFVRYIYSYGQDKVMFRTDFPVLTFEQMRAEVEGLGLRSAPLRKFLRDNAARLYKL
ncbi:amidohydrolase family protein [Roseomonas sp. 573]|uniref:Amidohydrolase family protein n=1 Tax=Roseomonas haemaphysalidis TaxID=2768162 RepID=A0ABS3KJW0_9PROT|nr:amidohydrolase family protein [Roseomonas haemaphysalidis]